METRARQCAAAILKENNIHVVSHIDADGLTSAAIICTALERAGKDYSVDFVRQLDGSILGKIADTNPSITVFTDLGSGMLEQINSLGLNAVVSDHHIPTVTGLMFISAFWKRTPNVPPRCMNC